MLRERSGKRLLGLQWQPFQEVGEAWSALKAS
jgi:hypothetical protein